MSEDNEGSDSANRYCRYGLVTELLQNGEPMHNVSQLVGHSHSMIAETYGHLQTSDLTRML